MEEREERRKDSNKASSDDDNRTRRMEEQRESESHSAHGSNVVVQRKKSKSLRQSIIPCVRFATLTTNADFSLSVRSSWAHGGSAFTMSCLWLIPSWRNCYYHTSEREQRETEWLLIESLFGHILPFFSSSRWKNCCWTLELTQRIFHLQS